MLRVGLTGGIGSGKSEVARRLASYGAVLIDSDVLAREVVAQGSDGLAEVVAEFGEELLRPDGTLDRAALGSRVFADPQARRRLEAIVHPRVRAAAASIAAAADPAAVVVHDIPLLVETGQQHNFDVVVVVDVPTSMQHERLVRERGMSDAEATARIEAQATRERRTGVADFVVDNTGSLADLDASVRQVWQHLERRRGRDAQPDRG